MTIKELKNKPLKMNLQHFAESEPQDPPGDSGEGQEGEGTDKVELTQEEINKQIEAESDRKLAKALEKKQKEWEEVTNQKIQEAIAEKERLSKLSEKERKEEELTKKEKELQQRIAEIERKELKADALTDLSEKGFPSEYNEFLADTLLAENAEKTLEKINKFKEMTDKMLNQMVKEQLRQDTPKAGGRISNGKVQPIAELAKEARLIK